jgi:hypothetical protein
MHKIFLYILSNKDLLKACIPKLRSNHSIATYVRDNRWKHAVRSLCLKKINNDPPTNTGVITRSPYGENQEHTFGLADPSQAPHGLVKPSPSTNIWSISRVELCIAYGERSIDTTTAPDCAPTLCESNTRRPSSRPPRTTRPIFANTDVVFFLDKGIPLVPLIMQPRVTAFEIQKQHRHPKLKPEPSNNQNKQWTHKLQGEV